MDAFDIVIMTVGAILLVVGLFMFVSGKRSESSESHVEGFGVKLNISNPSVLLIVFGALLMLVPRLLPKSVEPDKREELPIPGPQVGPGPDIVDDLQEDEPYVPDDVTPSGRDPDYIPPAQPQQPVAFFPGGRWQLDDYQENGIDLTDNVNGEILFQPQSPNIVQWHANYQVADFWGNVSYIQYNGTISYNNGTYFLNILQSTDPNFMGQNTVNLNMKMEGVRLHMEYFLNGSKTLAHWVQ